VPMNYIVDGKSYLEEGSDSTGGLDKIKEGKSTMSTSQPAVEMFASVFRKIRAEGNQIICLTLSSRLSGTYSSATIAAKETDEKNIKVVDTLSAVGSMRFLVHTAREQIAKKRSLEVVVTSLLAEREKLGNAFSVENMEPLKRSGRLGFVRQSVSSILNIRPILELKSGTLECVSFSRGKRNQLEKLVERIPETIKEILISELGNAESAKELSDILTAKFPHLKSPIITQVGPVLAIHLGIPAIGVAWRV